VLTREQSIEIRASPEEVFDLIHDYSRRLEWDPFLKKAELLHGAKAAGVGADSLCVAKNRLGGLGMETVYVVFDRPRVAAVKMVHGPAILQLFGASLRQDQLSPGTTRLTYKYTLETRPAWLRWFFTPICKWVFSRETRGRLAKLKSFLETADGNVVRSPIIFFDGVCAMCNTFVNIALRIDRRKIFLFAPLQGSTARELLPPLSDDPAEWSMIYLDETGIHDQLDASLEVYRRLGGVWFLLSLLRYIPHFIRDPLYRILARNRYRWFGRREQCRIPTESERQRFLP